MSLQKCIPAYWRGRFDGWRQAEAGLSAAHFTACVIHDVVAFEVITAALSICSEAV